MTSLGKALVLINVLFSGMAAIWAFGLYYNNVDWSDRGPTANKPGGKMWERKVQIDTLAPGAVSIPRARDRARAFVWTQEQNLRDDRLWYLAQIVHNETG